MAFINYLRFYFEASTKYQVHSPFVFDFVENILEDDRQYYFFRTIEKYRRLLYADKQKLTDPIGAKINTLAKKKGVGKNTGQLLFRLINHYKPSKALLIGVFPGIAALYQSTPSYKMSLDGIESNNQVASKLKYYFEEIGVPNIFMQFGSLDPTLSTYTENIDYLSYIYIKDLPTRYALEKLMKRCTTHSCLVLEKPYQSTAHLNSWNWLKDHEQTTLTIDIFNLGIVFFRKEQKEKEHYKLIRSLYKPWSLF